MLRISLIEFLISVNVQMIISLYIYLLAGIFLVYKGNGVTLPKKNLYDQGSKDKSIGTGLKYKTRAASSPGF
jgi:hypothetical protein